MHKSAVSHKE